MSKYLVVVDRQQMGGFEFWSNSKNAKKHAREQLYRDEGQSVSVYSVNSELLSKVTYGCRGGFWF